MNTIHPLLHGSIASLIAIGLAGVANTALAAKGDTEKCAGIRFTVTTRGSAARMGWNRRGSQTM